MKEKNIWFQPIYWVLTIFLMLAQTWVFHRQTSVFNQQNTILDQQKNFLKSEVHWSEFEQISGIRNLILEGKQQSDRDLLWEAANMGLVSCLEDLLHKEKPSVKTHLKVLLTDNDHTVSATVALALLGKKEELVNAELNRADFSTRSLEGAKISKSDLSQANFSRANLSGARLLNVKFDNVTLEQTTLFEVKLLGSSIQNVKFQNAIMGPSDFSKSHLANVTFNNTDLSGACFNLLNNYAHQKKSAFQDNNPSIILNNTKLTKTRFIDAKMNDTFFNSCEIIQGNFNHSDLSGSTFVNCDISKGKFRSSVLLKVIFKSTSSRPTSLRNSDFSNNAVFNSTFSKVDMSFAKCANTRFEQNRFNDVNFDHANLRGADLNDSNRFSGACSFANVVVDQFTIIDLNKLKPYRVRYFDPVIGRERKVSGSDLLYDPENRLRIQSPNH